MPDESKHTKVAIIHEMLIKMGGAEKVVLDLLELYPDADIYTMMYDEEKVGTWFGDKNVKVAPSTQRVFKLTKRPRACLPFMARAVESFDMSRYDLVVSSSSGFAHGVITQPGTTHVSYSHSPARYLWDSTHSVQAELGLKQGGIVSFLKNLLIQPLLTKLRTWDAMASERPDTIVANAREVQKRITKFYRRDSEVINPGVDTSFFQNIPHTGGGGYFVTVSALTPFKKLDLIIKACNQTGAHLKVIGGGPELENLRQLAGPTVEVLGRLNDKELATIYEKADGYIMAVKEDFGIAPVEAMATGMPVLAYGAGGARETIQDGMTGMFFSEQTVASCIAGITKFQEAIQCGTFKSDIIRQHAQSFDRKKFLQKISTIGNHQKNHVKSSKLRK